MNCTLVLGGAGMLGSSVFRLLGLEEPRSNVWAAVRTEASKALLPSELAHRVLTGFDASDIDGLIQLFSRLRPQIVVNCVGLVKQRAFADDPLQALPLNSIFPHRLAQLCALSDCRLIHISTDCVFSGSRGNYSEADQSDAADLYGRSKYLGEVSYPHTVTLRTSIIGHELGRKQGVIDWFLSEEHQIRGFRQAIFSGLPTVELARLIRDFVIPNQKLNGVFNIASEPISKYDLLKLVAKQYGKAIEIIPDDSLKIDRSLSGKKFETATGYRAPAWPELVRRMHEFR